MAEFINKAVAIEKTEVFCDVFDTKWTDEKVLAWIGNLPTVDAVPVVHGRWMVKVESYHDTFTDEYWDEEYFSCSVCGKNSDSTHNYCPNCGADMLEGEVIG